MIYHIKKDGEWLLVSGRTPNEALSRIDYGRWRKSNEGVQVNRAIDFVGEPVSVFISFYKKYDF